MGQRSNTDEWWKLAELLHEASCRRGVIDGHNRFPSRGAHRSRNADDRGHQRTRWTDERVVVWLAAHWQTGRGEGSSGLAFDELVDQPDQ